MNLKLIWVILFADDFYEYHCEFKRGFPCIIILILDLSVGAMILDVTRALSCNLRSYHRSKCVVSIITLSVRFATIKHVSCVLWYVNHFHSDMIAYDCYDASPIISSRCSSSGTLSCSSSPCSSDRDYSIESSSLYESIFDIDETDLGMFFLLFVLQ